MTKAPKSKSPLKLYFRAITYDDYDFFSRWGQDGVQLWKKFHSTIKPSNTKVGYASWIELCSTFEEFAKITDDPYIALSMARHHHEDFITAGPMVFMLNHVTNIRDFIDIAVRYLFLHSNGFRTRLEEDIEAQEARGIFDVHPLSGPHRQVLEHMLATVCMIGFKFVDGFAVKRVTFQHRPPEDLAPYKLTFGPNTEIEFNAPRNTVVTDIKILSLDRSSFLTKAINKSLIFYLNRQMKGHPSANTTIAGSVMEILPSLMGTLGTSMDGVAKSLGLHPKKMQRLLKDEHQSYQDILDTVRQYQAIRLLEDSDIAITHIAHHLDYASDRSFNIAFKRWYQMSPSQYRKAKSHT